MDGMDRQVECGGVVVCVMYRGWSGEFVIYLLDDEMVGGRGEVVYLCVFVLCMVCVCDGGNSKEKRSGCNFH